MGEKSTPDSLSTEHVSMVVYPRLPRNQVCFGSVGIEERHTVFTEKNKLFVEKIIVDPPDLLCCSVVREKSGRRFPCDPALPFSAIQGTRSESSMSVQSPSAFHSQSDGMA
jgi:hypothetical protein